MNSTPEKSLSVPSQIESKDKNKENINNNINNNIQLPNNIKYPRLKLDQKITLYFDPKINYISLAPILPISNIDLLFKLFNINHTKEELVNKIKQIISKNKNKLKRKNQEKEKQKITDEIFLRDCIILSKTNLDGPHSISDKISKKIFGEFITYKYNKNQVGKNYVLAYLKLKENIFLRSDQFITVNEAKLDVNKKIIKKYLPEETAEEIIFNFEDTKKREKMAKQEQKEKYEKFLEEANGDRKLLKKKRKLGLEEFSRRLPYFNMLHKDENNINNSNYNVLTTEEEDIMSEEFFINTENIPVNEILLGDQGIVDNHLGDFKYSPLKIFQMIKDSEKGRGVDFKIEYSQINDKKNYRHNNEVTIFSQKLGIKTIGCGNSREEAANKCALNLLAILFKKKFRTYCDLHRYFEKKNGRYLDVILLEENNKENINKNGSENIMENIKEKNNNENSNENIDENIIDEESLDDFDENNNYSSNNELFYNQSELKPIEVIEI